METFELGAGAGDVSVIEGRLLLEGTLCEGRLHFAGGRITRLELGLETSGAPSDLPVVAPGFVDLHVHGFGGCEPRTDLEGMATALSQVGTTSFQPTLFPAAPERLGETAAAVSERAQASASWAGAWALGLHLEGPFVNPRAAGALPPEDLAQPSVEALRAILGPASSDGRGVRTMTLAPELQGAQALIEELVRLGVRVSLGHSRSTAADARRAQQSGAVGVTHLYNAMNPLHHREAGLLGVALTRETLFAEIIGDLAHVGPEAIELALAARGPRGLCLVSDALEHAGTGCERFHARGREHRVVAGAAYWQDEEGRQSLAGSASSQLDMVRKLVQRGVVGLAEALTMASETPARALGLQAQIGRLAVGARADLVVLEGNELALDRVLVHGDEVARPKA